jgi:hypothetical protein
MGCIRFGVENMKNPRNNDSIAMIIISIIIAIFLWYMIKSGGIVVGCPASPH